MLTRFKNAMENEKDSCEDQEDMNPDDGDVKKHKCEDPGEDEYQADPERYE
jgi:hypothetical protein